MMRTPNTPRSAIVFLVAVTLFAADVAFSSLPPRGISLRGSALEAPASVALRAAGPMSDGAAAETEPWAAVAGTARTAFALLVALAVALVPMDGAEAARSGGRMGGSRMGGMGGRPRAPPPRAAPQPQQRGGGPNINIGVAPPVYGGFGGGFFGGPSLFGPSLLLPPPILPVPVPFGGGPSMQDRAIQDQQQRDERVIDQQKMQIDQMQKEIQDLKAKRQ
mmetsp:Transcript_82889/g.177669  ORF Transcript_82889/g.177669 Transcript_82889/m.177669 type:complete len:220 (+) Transcript_82889:95-754(+)